ncbi:hypothetical protein VNO80_15901 [Phaseolus coccineus]|uniref:Uncharacterized protein n=1 Tax=Phaseolus coccineus TaxID=3886 RepID=A0AAN9ML40_PHACN
MYRSKVTIEHTTQLAPSEQLWSTDPADIVLQNVQDLAVLFGERLARQTYERVEGNGVWFETIHSEAKIIHHLENDLGPGFIPPSLKYLQ